MKTTMMELTIREEVTQEMAEQIAEIENMYRFVRLFVQTVNN